SSYDGIYLRQGSSYNNVENNTANSNTYYGILLVLSSINNSIRNNVANYNGYHGIALESSSNSNNMIIGNTADHNGNGITMSVGSNNNLVANNTVNSNNENGFNLFGSYNNLFMNNNAADNGWDYYSRWGGTGNLIMNLSINQTIFSFTGKDFAIKGVETGPSDPPGHGNINKYFNVANTETAGWLNINLSYTEQDIAEAGIVESTLQIWKFNGSDWINKSFYNKNGVDTLNKVVYANITGFGSTFTPFGVKTDDVPPMIAFVPPTPIDVIIEQDFAFINVTSNESLSNALLEWNGTNETMLGSGISWYRNKINLKKGNYTFRVYGFDFAGNEGRTGYVWVYVNVEFPEPMAYVGNEEVIQQDSDNDAIGDVCDNCPEDYNPNQLNDDEDGYGTACECDDSDPSVYPGAPELCNSVDDDCNAATDDGVDEPWLGDSCDGSDSDLCEEGNYYCVAGSQECDDTSGDDLELCDGIDNDCDAATDDGVDEPWLGEACDGADSDMCEEGVYYCDGSQQCDDMTGDTSEVCGNQIDDDCDGSVDEGCGGPDGSPIFRKEPTIMDEPGILR
ncbi:MAG: right-handed parallel beta-helix repeat-containing protein, partial [Nanoarchaeota archaeon]|nr:right-handed parallel beta-helix repeat-containing protein [Nanoarchaeota archaeon]